MKRRCIDIEIGGNTESLKKSIMIRLKALDEMEYPREDFIPWVLAEELATLTSMINREISVYLNRKGMLTDISIGDSSTVSLPEAEGRRGRTRLSGIRCIHTHPNGDGQLSTIDLNSMLGLNLDAIIAIGVKEGRITV
ncbi:MAG: GTPase HflX, partial [Clostridiales bacterium]|nr:GTPase HflX [Clostridiales bacterium]